VPKSTIIASTHFPWLVMRWCEVTRSSGEFLEAIQCLRLAPTQEVEAMLTLLDRLCAMLTRLAGLSYRPRQE
jgi:hypothetical protein